jgi:hypothetical protein
MSAWEEYAVQLNIPEHVSTHRPELVSLFLRGTKDSNFRVMLNGVFIEAASAQLAETYQRKAHLLPEDDVYVFTIPLNLLKYGVNGFHLRSIQPAPFFMKRIEVAVSYGNVRQFGYF